MQQEKRRPTLEELKSLPMELWRLECAQICCDADDAFQDDLAENAERLMCDPDLTPEKIVELRDRLRCATGSTETENAA